MVALLSWNNICISVTETQATHVASCDCREDWLCTQEKLGHDSQIQLLLPQPPKLFQLASLSVRRLGIILTSLGLWRIKPQMLDSHKLHK